MLDAFVPESEAKRAARELARLKRSEPFAVPAMLQSPWHVPVRWFVLVGDAERHFVETSPEQYRLYYWTSIGVARKRAEHALQVLRRSELAPIAEPVQELAEWLSAFHPKSMLELDYASVSTLFGWDELDDDHSARDVHAALRALSSEEFPRSAELYQSVIGRWAEIRAHESTN